MSAPYWTLLHQSPRARWAQHSRERLAAKIADVLAKAEAPEHAFYAFDSSLETKAVATGMEFSGYSSTWAGPDEHGDAIEPGAYRATIASWKESGEKLPLLDSHKRDTLRALIGYAIELREDTKGLFSRWRMLDTRDGEEAYARIEAKLLSGLSIGYQVRQQRQPNASERKAGITRVLQRIDLVEVSLVMEPANREARIIGKRRRAGMEEKLEDLLDNILSADRETCTRLLSNMSDELAADLRARLRHRHGMAVSGL